MAVHVSKQLLKHYSHICMEAKRRVLEEIVNKNSAAVESGTYEAPNSVIEPVSDPAPTERGVLPVQ
jgi:hypothetical protein